MVLSCFELKRGKPFQMLLLSTLTRFVPLVPKFSLPQGSVSLQPVFAEDPPQAKYILRTGYN